MMHSCENTGHQTPRAEHSSAVGLGTGCGGPEAAGHAHDTVTSGQCLMLAEDKWMPGSVKGAGLQPKLITKPGCQLCPHSFLSVLMNQQHHVTSEDGSPPHVHAEVCVC